MKLNIQQISVLCFVLASFVCVQGKGGSGSGGGGGRGGGGGTRGGIGRGGSSSSAKGLTKSRAAVILGSGAAGYAAYRSYKNLKKDRDDKDKDGADFDSFEQYISDTDGKFDYKTQESTSYYASEGIGMSAWGLILLILGIIALGTIGWYCCNVFLPVWEDNRQMRNRESRRMGGRMKDEVPLQETPSTATPSP